MHERRVSERDGASEKSKKATKEQVLVTKKILLLIFIEIARSWEWKCDNLVWKALLHA